MSETTATLAPERIAALARAALECERFVSPIRAAAASLRALAVEPLSDAEQRGEALKEVEGLLATRRGGGAAPSAAAAAGVSGPTADLLKQRAALDLQLKTEAQKLADLDAAHKKEQNEHRQAIESLSLQQKKIKEMGDDRGRLLSVIGELESKLRLQMNETEQALGKFEKLKASRQTMGEQATAAAEEINALKEENQRLRQEVEAALRERDTRVASAKAEAAEAESQTADTAFVELWKTMQAELPEVFVETHVPNRKTFDQLGEAFVEMLRVALTIEMHVHHMLRDLRQVSEQSDKLNHFYIMFTKNPGLLETLKDFLVSGKRKGNFTNLLRAHQAWARAFGSGLYKLIVRSPVLISDEMNHRSWPIKSGFTVGEDAAIGKYYKETASKVIPEKLGTNFRKQAGDMAYEDYNDLMKRK